MFEISRRREQEKKIDRGSSVDASLTFGPDEQVIFDRLSAGVMMKVGQQPTPHPHITANNASSSMRFTSQVAIFNKPPPPPENSTPAPEVIEEITPTPSFGEFIPQKTDKGSGIIHVTTTPKDDGNEEQKRERLRNFLFSQILDAIDENLNKNMQDDLRNRIIEDLWEDFSSNQEYQSSITANAPGSTQQNPPIPPTRYPLTSPDKYIAKLTPKTYYGVGIQTELVQKENQNSFLQINQFYDDSGFESALKSKVPPIETANKDFKITAIYCKLGDEEKFYSIDEIFTNCGQDEKVFNLKLCDIFRNLEKRELKLKFSTIEDSIEDQELTIQKSVFTKEAEENSSYKNIKTVIGHQTVTRDLKQTTPTRAPSNPKNIRPAVDLNPFLVC